MLRTSLLSSARHLRPARSRSCLFFRITRRHRGFGTSPSLAEKARLHVRFDEPGLTQDDKGTREGRPGTMDEVMAAKMETLRSPLFTQRVVTAMQALYPLELADRSWDNVGLLQDNVDPAHPLCPPSAKKLSETVLLTNDLTLCVVEEAIEVGASVIVTYHPFIFRGMKSVTLSDPHQRIVLMLAKHNIAVYSPHTAVDAVPSGLNSWLADIVSDNSGFAQISVVQPVATSALPASVLRDSFEGSGYGRLVKLDRDVMLGVILQRLCKGLGGLRYLSVALPEAWKYPNSLYPVRSVAVCAGSGYDVLKDADADLFVTGEMSHHSALRLTMMGKAVVTVFHSNSERAFLKQVMQPALAARLPDSQVLVSARDGDPFEVWDVRDMPQ